MEITQLLAYLAAYLLFLLLQAVFINGIKISASGETKKSPSGKDIDSEMILYPLYKFLTQHHFVEVHYAGEQLKEVVAKINSALKSDYGSNGATLYLPDSVDRPSKLKQINILVDPDIRFCLREEWVVLYKTEKVYRFSKYLRKPIIQCVVCMASFWGLFTYWPLMYFVYGVNYFTFILWILNTFCLSYINFIIFKAHK